MLVFCHSNGEQQMALESIMYLHKMTIKSAKIVTNSDTIPQYFHPNVVHDMV